MQRGERRQLRANLAELQRWVDRAGHVSTARAGTQTAGDEAAHAISRRVVSVRKNGTVGWKAIPIAASDRDRLPQIARATALPTITSQEQELLGGLLTKLSPALKKAPLAVSGRRFVAGGKKRAEAQMAADYLGQYFQWAQSSDLPRVLKRLEAHSHTTASVRLSDVLNPDVGLDARIAWMGAPRQVVPVSDLADLPAAVTAVGDASRREAFCRKDAIEAARAVQSSEVAALLARMPIEALRDASKGQIRVAALTSAGIPTVGALLARSHQLEHLPGIGAVTAKRMRGAAQGLKQVAEEETAVRIDVANRTPEASTLLRRLAAWDAARKNLPDKTATSLAESLGPLSQAISSDVRHVILISATRPLAELSGMVDDLVDASANLALVEPHKPVLSPWADFEARPADYYAMLAELGFLGEDEQTAYGELPDDVIEAIRTFELATEHLSVSLRGYQSFGARFALVQRKVIIGDEMGLGKTVEALAVLAHLQAHHQTHFLVVCPAAVVTNWMREVASKSALRAHRIHGLERHLAAHEWIEHGGVGVTTFETLGWLMPSLGDVKRLGCVVVDEAHYIKNPSAKRSQRCALLLKRARWAMLLTGTPMENRIEEFGNLVGYLRPDLVVDGDELRPRRFRAQVAPAYLRRNQEDVLSELPELIEVDECLSMSDQDERIYRCAVQDRHFMRMRQAAMLSGSDSEKLKRLLDIVEEAEASGRRVIVYSYFLSVLDRVAESLPGKVFGPLTGSVPAAARQTMVDEFSKAENGAVLVSQITAGGVGLNVQAASVVIICEPQLKPTAEWQAIARAHRMGQLKSVQVHRLVSEEGVDQRIREILTRKTQLFEDFARVSETAESAPEAFDITEAEIARQVVAAEQQRLGMAELEEAG